MSKKLESNVKLLADEWNDPTMPVLLLQLFRKEYDAMEKKINELINNNQFIIVTDLASFFGKKIMGELLKYLSITDIQKGLTDITNYIVDGREANIVSEPLYMIRKWLPVRLDKKTKDILIDNEFEAQMAERPRPAPTTPLDIKYINEPTDPVVIRPIKSKKYNKIKTPRQQLIDVVDEPVFEPYDVNYIPDGYDAETETEDIYENDINTHRNNIYKMEEPKPKRQRKPRKINPEIKEAKELQKEIKRLVKKFEKINIQINKKLDKIDGFKTIKPKQKAIDFMYDRVRELKIVDGILNSIVPLDEHHAIIIEEVSKRIQKLTKKIDDKYYEVEQQALDAVAKKQQPKQPRQKRAPKLQPVAEPVVEPVFMVDKKNKTIQVSIPNPNYKSSQPKQDKIIYVDVPVSKLRKSKKDIQVIPLEESPIPDKVIDKKIIIKRKPKTPKAPAKKKSRTYKEIQQAKTIKEEVKDGYLYTTIQFKDGDTQIIKTKPEVEEEEYIPKLDEREKYRNKLEKMTISQLENELVNIGAIPTDPTKRPKSYDTKSKLIAVAMTAYNNSL